MSEEEKQLVPKEEGRVFHTRCSYQVLDSKTGEMHTCNNKAVSADYNFCFKHLRQVGNPAARRAGRYEDNMPDAMRQNFEHQLADDRPQDLTPEIAQARALIDLQWQRIRNVVDEEGNVVTTFKDLEALMGLNEAIRKLTETQARVNPEGFVPIDDVRTIFSDMVNIIRKVIPSDQMSMREKLVGEIQKYCVGEVETKVVKVTAGNQPRANKQE